jgi:phage tail-like protein
MATKADDIKNKYPLPVFHYKVEIDGMSGMNFSQVSGLNLERQVITYKDGLSCTEGPKLIPGIEGTPKLTLKKGIVKGDSKLYDWISSTKITTIDKKDITISLMDETGSSPVVTWTVSDAFPTKLEAPSFNATSNEVAIESLELTANSIKIKYA